MRIRVLALSFGCSLLLVSSAFGQNGLSFFKNYFVAGDYVVGGVGLRGTGVNGAATGTLHMTGVPANADIMAAFLFWETVVTDTHGSGTAGATFRGFDISAIARELNPAGTAPCWSSGGATGSSSGAHVMKAYRADVLRFLPIGAIAGQPNYGKLLVNDADLAAHAQPLTVVSLPDAGRGNVVPSTAGASLVVIYRDPARPLNAITIYNGGYTMDQRNAGLSQTIRGFYQASTRPQAKMTHIVGDGQSNFSDRVQLDGQLIATDAFNGAAGPASDPAWDNVTFDNLPLAANAASATVTVDGAGSTPYDCLSWGAIIFSTTVQDTDGDGLLDVWETTSNLVDPNGRPLPDLRAMGANPRAKDLFVEIGYMTTTGYVNPAQGAVGPHSHLPSKAALDRVGDAFKNAPVANPDGTTGIRAHFDVGSNYQTSPADPYIIPAALARGGETILETACVPSATRRCQFPDYPGTVGWKSAYHFYRDQPLNYPDEPSCVAEASGPCVRRFDRERKDIFHYALFAHALGLARSDVDNPGTPFDERTTPKNTSGIADPPGGDLMVTLGFWDGWVGSDFMQASTLYHELGHNFGLKHGGVPLQPNCKPNYQSVMNYLFQVRGLTNAAGQPVIDYSRQVLGALDESSLDERTGLGSTLYRGRWYAPASSSFVDSLLGTTAALKHCDGSPLTPEEVAAGVRMVRIDATTTSAPTDWDGDGTVDAAPIAQDVTFDGTRRLLDAGVNDYARLDLRHVGSRRNVGSGRLAGPGRGGSLSLDMGYGDVGYGDVGYGDVGYGDVGYGDVGYGDVGYGDVGYGDVGYGDVGTGDLGYGDVGAPRGDVDLDTATALGNSPNSLQATVGKQSVTLRWDAPHVGAVNTYDVYRVLGASVTPSSLVARVLVGIVTAPATTIVDTTVKNNVTYTYLVIARFVNGTQSGVSNYVTVLVK